MSKHLGGHYNITHLDHGALNWAVKTFNVSSMIDVGCGPGGMVRYAKALGLTADGIDGDPSVKSSILHDFTQGSLDVKEYDLAWCVEFVEHVEEKYIDNFFSVFSKCKYLIMTHAVPGQKGWHHVNCQEEDYWVQKLKNINFVLDKEYTKTLRNESTMNLNNRWEPYMRKTGLFFRRVL